MTASVAHLARRPAAGLDTAAALPARPPSLVPVDTLSPVPDRVRDPAMPASRARARPADLCIVPPAGIAARDGSATGISVRT